MRSNIEDFQKIKDKLVWNDADEKLFPHEWELFLAEDLDELSKICENLSRQTSHLNSRAPQGLLSTFSTVYEFAKLAFSSIYWLQ